MWEMRTFFRSTYKHPHTTYNKLNTYLLWKITTDKYGEWTELRGKKEKNSKDPIFSRFPFLRPFWKMVRFFIMPKRYWFLLSWLRSRKGNRESEGKQLEFKFRHISDLASHRGRKRCGKILHMIYRFLSF